MKNIFAILILLASSLEAQAAPRFTDAEIKFMGDGSAKSAIPLGSQLIDRSVRVLQCRYDRSVDSGAVGTVTLREATSNKSPCSLPDDAIITQVWVDTITTMTSTGNNGTIALQANSAGDLLATIDADTIDDTTAIFAGVPVGTAATMVKLTAARDIKMVIATNAILTGKLNVFIEYVAKSE